MERVGVFGSGAWGTALANACARAGREVRLWGRDREQMRSMERDRENLRRLPGFPLEPNVACGHDLDYAARSDLLLAVVPAQAFRAFAGALAAHAPRAPLIICAKGIERGSGAFLTDIAREILPQAPAGVLSGPSFARDVAARLPTAVTLALADEGLAERVALAVSSPAFRLYRTTDVRGAEIGGAAKNVLAIACGMASGADLGASATAALLARGFAEMRRYGRGFGARPETLMGLSGLGDLVLTCSSPQSRNFALGARLGRGLRLEEALGGELAEGAFTAPVLVATARARGLEMPIAEAVAAILEGELGVGEAVERLLARPLRAEG